MSKLQKFNKKYNLDQKRRDEIIFGSYDPGKYKGGLRYYEGLTLENVEALVEEGFTTKNYKYNSSPTIEAFMDFMRKHEGYTAFGLAVSLDRDDYRFEIEGLEKNEPAASNEERSDFLFTFSQADELLANNSRMRCWFD